MSSKLLFGIGIMLFSVALVEALVAWILWEPADGANIGGGIAIGSTIAAGLAAVAGRWLRKGRGDSVGRWAVVIGAILALLFAAQGAVLVAFGIAEEL